jgi:diguanylate cyclase (GGDEF)-like protein
VGGDQFGVILEQASIECAMRTAETLAAAIAGSPAVYCGVAHRLAASIGVHALAGTEDPELALARADEAMYAARHARKRNRAVDG